MYKIKVYGYSSILIEEYIVLRYEYNCTGIDFKIDGRIHAVLSNGKKLVISTNGFYSIEEV